MKNMEQENIYIECNHDEAEYELWSTEGDSLQAYLKELTLPTITEDEIGEEINKYLFPTGITDINHFHEWDQAVKFTAKSIIMKIISKYVMA